MRIKWVNCYRRSEWNIGDRFSSPCRYYPELRNIPFVDIEDTDGMEKAEAVLFGGGGMLYGESEKRMEHAVKKLDRTIVWGCGINRDSLDGGYPSWLSECLAVGLRDAVPLYDWVPCASCLAFQFDDFRRTTPKHPVVVYQHYERENIPILPDAPRFSNGSSFVGLDRTLDFLASGDAIVTNSYHGLYWGLLLGRRVISWAPKQPKYRLLHPAAVDLHHADDLPAALSSARPDRDFLETCRTANDKFFNMVKGFLLA